MPARHVHWQQESTVSLTSRRVLIIGEAYGREEALVNEPFVGAAGRLIRGILRDSGYSGEWVDRPDLEGYKRLWTPDDIHFTNVVNTQPRPTNDFGNLCGPRVTGIPGLPKVAEKTDGYLRSEFAPEIARLWDEIQSLSPNLIITLGNVPTAILTRSPSKISKNRGTITLSEHVRRPDGSPIKILPTYHPAAVLREWTLRPILMRDIFKSRRHYLSPEFSRPSRLIWLEPTLADLAIFYREHLAPNLSAPWGVDIETAHGTITEIGFARPDIGIVVPFFSRAKRDGNYWSTRSDELLAWKWVKKVCQDLRFPVFQNGLYDLNYLLRYGIPVPHAGADTMLRWHSVQPEMKKSLGFLGSILTDEPSWKFMRTDHATLKKEDE